MPETADRSDMSSVSVIIPIYNSARYLEEAVDSALSQTFPPSEIILVDDGSTGDRVVIDQLCETHPKVRLVRLNQNHGVSFARNAGITNAVSEFILFLDADDKLAPPMIEQSLKMFETLPEADVVISKGEVFRGEISERAYLSKKAVFEYNQRTYGDKSFADKSFFLIYSPMIHAMLFRKKVFDKARFREDLKYGEDRFLWMELRRKGVQFLTAGWLGGYYRLNSSETKFKTRHQKEFFEKLLKSGLLSTSFETGYVHSFLFLLSLKSGDLRGILKYGARAFFSPGVLFGRIRKFIWIRYGKG